MAFKATFVHGSPRMIDHTPGTAVAAGDVVVLTDTVGIAHLDIAANQLGALAAGDGVYSIAKPTGAGTGSTKGQLQYWDDTAKQAVESAASGANKQIGYAAAASADSDTTVLVYHQPA